MTRSDDVRQKTTCCACAPSRDYLPRHAGAVGDDGHGGDVEIPVAQLRFVPEHTAVPDATEGGLPVGQGESLPGFGLRIHSSGRKVRIMHTRIEERNCIFIAHHGALSLA